MPATTSAPKIRHEDFCLPRPEAEAPRIESYPYYEDDPTSGRSRITHQVHRCIECGATAYEEKN